MAVTGPVGSFDPHRPPARQLLDECVHCGFCLPACPTYQLDGQEMDSPRGRIYLMDLAERGEIPLAGAFTRHIDSCLGCLACVPACPSGVKYDQLLAAARGQVERNAPRGRGERVFRWMVFALFPYPGRLRFAALLGLAYQKLGLRVALRRLGGSGRLPPRLRAAEELLPPLRLRQLLRRPARFTPAAGAGPPRRRVALLTGCAQRVFFGDVNAATVRVLAAAGCEVILPRGQRCCGALSLHAGREAEARRRARALIDAFGRYRVDTVVTNVAGCGSALKEYGGLLADEPRYATVAAQFAGRVRDVTELLAELAAEPLPGPARPAAEPAAGPAAARRPAPLRVAYHDACHLAHAQRIRRQPRDLLRRVPGLELLEVAEGDLCCGSAGIHNLVQPEAAEALGRRKAAHLAAAAPDVVATANAGCLLHIRRFLPPGIPIVHPVQLIDASLRDSGPDSPRPGPGAAFRRLFR